MESTASKILVILIALLVVIAAGIGGWHLFQSHVSPTTNSSIGPTYTSSGTNPSQTSVTTAAGTGSPPQGQADITAEYNSAFASLSVKTVSFSTVTASTTGPVANLYALYSKDETASKQLYPNNPFTLDVAAVDLNGDGVPEALVYEDSQGFCGSGGCQLDIFQAQNGKWVRVGTALAGPEIGIGSTVTNGYADLYLSVDEVTTSVIKKYAWNGTAYKPGAIMATWDGSKFNIVK